MVDWTEVWNDPAPWAVFGAGNVGIAAFHALEGRLIAANLHAGLFGFGTSMAFDKSDRLPSRDEAVRGARTAWNGALGTYFDARHADHAERYVGDVIAEDGLPDRVEPEEAVDAGTAAVRESFIDAPRDYTLNEMEDVVTGAINHLAYEARTVDWPESVSLDTFNETAPTYTIGRPEKPGKELDPEWIADVAYAELVDYCWAEAQSRADKIAFVEETVMGDRTATEVEWIDTANPLDQSRDYYNQIREEMNEPDAVETAAIQDLITSAMGLAMNKDDAYKETLDAFKHFFNRYDPSVYEGIFDTGNTYTVDLLDDASEAKNMLSASGSCISDLESYAEEFISDDHTLFFGLQKNRQPLGYMRTFVMEDAAEEPFLAVDTMEIDHKNFEEHSDMVKACGLAAAQAGIDLGHAYVAGTDARVKFGPRQAYGNTSRTLDYHKFGPSVQDYHFQTRDPYEGEEYWSIDAYLLIENPMHFPAADDS